MKSRVFATVLIAGLLAAILQPSLSPRIAILGAHPDLFLVFLSAIALYQNRLGGAWTGFFFGILQGGLPTGNMTHYAISRLLTGFAVGGANGLCLSPTPGLAAMTAVLATLMAQTIWMFIAAPSGIGAFLGDTIRIAVYNGVLAIPVYALLKKILGTPMH